MFSHDSLLILRLRHRCVKLLVVAARGIGRQCLRRLRRHAVGYVVGPMAAPHTPSGRCWLFNGGKSASPANSSVACVKPTLCKAWAMHSCCAWSSSRCLGSSSAGAGGLDWYPFCVSCQAVRRYGCRSGIVLASGSVRHVAPSRSPLSCLQYFGKRTFFCNGRFL